MKLLNSYIHFQQTELCKCLLLFLIFPLYFVETQLVTSMKNAFNLLQYFEVQRHMDMHDRRILLAQPTIRVPRQLTHRSCNHIKKQPLAEFNRIVTIDIENKALLKKLTDKSPSRIGRQKPYKLIKNNRKKNLDEYKQRLENEGLLKRIKQAKSSYLSCKFATDRKVTQSYINAISKFGFKNMTPNKTLIPPFCKRSVLRFTKPEHKQTRSFDSTEPTESKKEKREVQSQLTGLSNISHDQKLCADKIISIQILPYAIQNKDEANITYLVWSSKISLQIDWKQMDSMCLQIPRSVFDDCFEQNIKKLHESIKFDEEYKQFYINLPRMPNIRKDNKENNAC